MMRRKKTASFFVLFFYAVLYSIVSFIFEGKRDSNLKENKGGGADGGTTVSTQMEITGKSRH